MQYIVPRQFRVAVVEFVSLVRDSRGRSPAIYEMPGARAAGLICGSGIIVDFAWLWIVHAAFGWAAVQFVVLHEIGHNTDCSVPPPELDELGRRYYREFVADQFAAGKTRDLGVSIEPAFAFLRANGRCRVAEACSSHPDAEARIQAMQKIYEPSEDLLSRIQNRIRELMAVPGL